MLWTQIGFEGFGTRSNYSVRALAALGHHVYAGTTNYEGQAQVWRIRPYDRYIARRWQNVTPRWHMETHEITSMVAYQNVVYIGTEKGQIWRLQGFPQNVAVPFDRGGRGISSMVAFGRHLYVSKVDPLEIWRSSSLGYDDWERVMQNGFDDPANNAGGRFGILRNGLCVGTGRAQPGVAGDGCEVWYSPNGNAGSWTQINSDGFGDPQNAVCGALGEFQGALCVGTVNHQAAQLWRYDGSSWTNVSPDFRGDFGGVNPRVQSMTPAYQFTVLASRLFIGGGNPFPPIGADLWSTGNISGPAPRWEFAAPRGFGNPHNRFIEVLLYRFPYVFASTYNQEDGAEVWMGDALPEWLEGKEPYQWQPVSVGRVATTVLGLLEQVPQVMTYAAAITLRPIRILVLSRIWRRFDRTNDYRQPELTKSDDSVGRPPQ